MDIVKKVIEAKARKVISYYLNYNNFVLSGEYTIAGGCLSSFEEIKDVDIFNYNKLLTEGNYQLTHNTLNAKTYKYLKNIIQLCEYRTDSLSELINGFDFSHCQVGVLVEGYEVKQVYYTPAYEEFLRKQKTWYLGSKFPASSLGRLLRFRVRNILEDFDRDFLKIKGELSSMSKETILKEISSSGYYLEEGDKRLVESIYVK